MTYTTNSHITTIQEVEQFFWHLRNERKLSFNPDSMFEDYVSCQGGINTITLPECTLYNRLMDECFRVCDREGMDIYMLNRI